MKKIFFETLKHKLGHYLLVILCGILMVSTIYVSYAFSDSIEGIIHGQNSGIVEEMYTFINFQETYILFVYINGNRLLFRTYKKILWLCSAWYDGIKEKA